MADNRDIPDNGTGGDSASSDGHADCAGYGTGDVGASEQTIGNMQAQLRDAGTLLSNLGTPVAVGTQIIMPDRG